MNIALGFERLVQPAPYDVASADELTVAVASLSLGGAERIVLDWANRIHPRWRVHLIVLRNREKEWPIPPHVRVTRVESDEPFVSITPRLATAHLRRVQALAMLGSALARSPIPVCVCHLLNKDERDALASYGATAVPVLHNAKEGWMEDASCLAEAAQVIAVSDACADDLRMLGFSGAVSVVRHIPPRRKHRSESRTTFRAAWGIPQDALVIGMVGAVKVQKNYRRALQLFKALRNTHDAYLVIVGGPVNVREEGKVQWDATVAEVHALGIRSFVAMPGFIPDATRCFPAFDLFLNTSNFEGMSIATLEALQAGLPVVAAKVGGQGEVSSPGLHLLPADAPDAAWLATIARELGTRYPPPEWSQFPAYRLWTLCGLARETAHSGKTLFVTSNLNSGGAQRSLVNLASRLARKADFEVVVAGDSSNAHFYKALEHAGVAVSRTSTTQDAFSHAEALVHKICAERIGTVCFWNLDKRVKLLLLKAMAATTVRFIDASPGQYAFEELEGAAGFQRLIAFSTADYYRRLDTLVLKYEGAYPPEFAGTPQIIRNGVALRQPKEQYRIDGAPRVVVNGRIAPSKFLEEIIEAMHLVRKRIPHAELHIFGGAEHSEEDYYARVHASSARLLGTSARFHGTDFTAAERLREFDACVVLGKHQGCPNALLEALSCGLPVVANDDGGTREQVIDGVTGLLIPDCDPRRVADALTRILADRILAARLGKAGRVHVKARFSMQQMADQYLELIYAKKPKPPA